MHIDELGIKDRIYSTYSQRVQKSTYIIYIKFYQYIRKKIKYWSNIRNWQIWINTHGNFLLIWPLLCEFEVISRHSF